MAYGSKLEWTNISVGDMDTDTQVAFREFKAAKAKLEGLLARDAITAEAANEGDSFAFAYRSIDQDMVGMAIGAKAKVQSKSGFAGLKRAKALSLVEYQEQRKAEGR